MTQSKTNHFQCLLISISCLGFHRHFVEFYDNCVHGNKARGRHPPSLPSYALPPPPPPPLFLPHWLLSYLYAVFARRSPADSHSHSVRDCVGRVSSRSHQEKQYGTTALHRSPPGTLNWRVKAEERSKHGSNVFQFLRKPRVINYAHFCLANTISMDYQIIIKLY